MGVGTGEWCPTRWMWTTREKCKKYADYEHYGVVCCWSGQHLVMKPSEATRGGVGSRVVRMMAGCVEGTTSRALGTTRGGRAVYCRSRVQPRRSVRFLGVLGIHARGRCHPSVCRCGCLHPRLLQPQQLIRKLTISAERSSSQTQVMCPPRWRTAEARATPARTLQRLVAHLAAAEGGLFREVVGRLAAFRLNSRHPRAICAGYQPMRRRARVRWLPRPAQSCAVPRHRALSGFPRGEASRKLVNPTQGLKQWPWGGGKALPPGVGTQTQQGAARLGGRSPTACGERRRGIQRGGGQGEPGGRERGDIYSGVGELEIGLGICTRAGR